MIRAAKQVNPGKKRMVFSAFAMAAAMGLFLTFPARADGSLELHTEYPGISVKPGDSLSIPVSIDNLTGSAADVSGSVLFRPGGRAGYLPGGSFAGDWR